MSINPTPPTYAKTIMCIFYGRNRPFQAGR